MREHTGLFTSNQVQKLQKSGISASRTHRPSNLRRGLAKKPTYIGGLRGRCRRNIQKMDQGCESRAPAWVRSEDRMPVHRA